MLDGCPVYRLEPYTLYGFIDTIGISIYREGRIWKFKRDRDGVPLYQKYGTQQDPFGYWPNGMRIEPYY